MAHCGNVLLEGQLAFAAAVWGTERLAGLGGCAPLGLEGVEVVAGRRSMVRALERARGGAVWSRLSVSSSPYAAESDAQTSLDAQLTGQGVRLRAVYQKSEAGPAVLPSGDVEIRTTDLVPMDMLVVDDRLAVLPVDPDRPGLALVVVRDRAWVRLASAVAESCWARAEGADGDR
jgi:hypothetical protein